MSAGPWAVSWDKTEEQVLGNKVRKVLRGYSNYPHSHIHRTLLDPRLSIIIQRALCKPPRIVSDSQPHSAYFVMALIHGIHKGNAARVTDKLRPDQRSPGEQEMRYSEPFEGKVTLGPMEDRGRLGQGLSCWVDYRSTMSCMVAMVN